MWRPFLRLKYAWPLSYALPPCLPSPRPGTPSLHAWTFTCRLSFMYTVIPSHCPPVRCLFFLPSLLLPPWPMPNSTTTLHLSYSLLPSIAPFPPIDTHPFFPPSLPPSLPPVLPTSRPALSTAPSTTSSADPGLRKVPAPPWKVARGTQRCSCRWRGRCSWTLHGLRV